MMLKHDGAYILPLRPDWKTPVGIDWEYKTNVFRADDGKEWRRAQREKPRRRVEFNSLETSDKARDLRTALAVSIGLKSIIPDFVRGVELVAAEAPATSFPMSPIPYWLRTGRAVAFVSKTGFVIRGVTSTIDNIVVVDTEVPVEYQRRICPAIIGRVRSSIVENARTSAASDVAWDFEEDPTTALDPLDPLADETGLYFYRGYPVFPFVPDWSKPVDNTFERRLDVLDFGYGASEFYTPEPESRWTGKLGGWGRAEDIYRLEDFFFRRKGQRGIFYCPTWTDDLIVTYIDPIFRDLIHVRGSAAVELFDENLTYRNIILLSLNEMACAGVRSAAVNLDGETVFKLDAALPEDFGPVRRASWLFMARFASDILSLTWETTAVAQYGVAVTSVIDLFYELTIGGDRVTIAFDYVTIPPDFGNSTLNPMLIAGENLLYSGEYAA